LNDFQFALGSNVSPPRGQPVSQQWAITGPGNPTFDNPNSDFVTVTNLTVGNYNLYWIVSVAGCGQSLTSAGSAFTVDPLPKITSNLTATVCSGFPFSYTVTSDVSNSTFTWNRNTVSNIANAPASASISSVNESLVNNTSSNVLVFYDLLAAGPSPTNCGGIPSVLTVTVLPSPAASSNPSSDTKCSGQPLNFALTSNLPSTVFSWTVSVTSGVVNSVTSGSGSNISQTATAIGAQATFLYRVTPVNSITGCSALSTFDIPVTINILPTVAGTGLVPTVCGFSPAAFTLSTNASTFTWSNGQNTNPAFLTPSVTGLNTFSVTVGNGLCSVTTTVGVFSQPLVTVTSTNATICGLVPTSRLLITNGTTFVWNTGQTTNPATLTPTVFGLNTFTATVSSGLCSVITSVGIVAIAPLSVAGTNATVCGLTAANISITTNGVNINWFNGATTSATTVIPTALGTTNYAVTITSSVCQIVTTVGVTAVLPVTVSGNNATVCGLTPTSFTLTTNGNNFNWSTGQVTNPATLTPLSFGLNTFNVTVSSAFCSVTTSVGLTATAPVTIAGNVVPTVCGISATAYTLTTNGVAFAWSNGQATNPATLTPIALGLNNFTATVTSGVCRATTTVGIFVQSPITVQGVNATVCGLNSSNISVLTNGSINWFNGAATASISVVPASAGMNNYNATVTSGSCGVTTTVSVLSLAVVTVSGTNASVCGLNPTSVSLITNGSTFSWSTGQSTNPAIITPLLLGLNTFTVTVSSGLCNAITTVGIVASAPITVAGISTQTVCGLASTIVTLTTNGNTFSWNNGQITNPATLTPVSAGLNNFSVAIGSGSCSASTTVGVFSLGVVTNILGNPASPICSGASVNVTASSVPIGAIFNWVTQVASGTVNGNSNVSASNSINQSLTSTGLGIVTYTVVGTLNGCAGSPAIFNITVNPAVSQPTFISGSSPVCQGTTNVYQTDSPASLGASSITWSVFPASAGSQISTQNVTTVNWNAAFSGNVTLTSTAFGCGSSQGSFSRVLGISASPTFISQLTQQNNSCIADNGIITATSTSAPISIRLNNTINPTSFFAGVATYSNLSAGTYTVVMRNAAGCSTSSTGYNITAPAIPIAPVAVSAPAGNYCEGASIPNLTLTVPGGMIGFYSSGLLFTITSSIQSLILPATSGIYNYSANVTVNGCVSPSTSINYTISPSPSITGITGMDPSTCAATDGSLTVTGFATTYRLGSIANNTGIFTNLAPITHLVTASIGLCSVTSSITLAAPGQPSAPTLAGGNTYCVGQAVTLLTVTSTLSGTFGLYNALNVLVETQIGGSNAVFNTTALGTYYANITVAGCGSAQSNAEVIQFNPLPAISISGNNLGCIGNVLTITADAGIGASYAWSGGTSGNIAFYNNTGIKTVFATVAGCSSSLNFTTTINPVPTVSVLASQTTVCTNASVTLTGSGANSYTWLPSLAVAPSIVVAVSGNINVTAVGTDLNGCVGTDVVSLFTAVTISAIDQPLGNAVQCSSNGTFSYNLPNTKAFYNASTFNWALVPASAGAIIVSTAPNEHIASLTWNASFSGIATISVVGLDACGNTSANSLNVNISPLPTISSIITTDPSSCNASDGAITISGIAASGLATYVNLTSNTTAVSGIYAGLSASPIATYSLRISDGISGCFADTVANLNPVGQPATPTLSGGDGYCTYETVFPLIATSTITGEIALYLSPDILVASINGTSLSFIPSVSGDYFATFSSGGCVSNSTQTEFVDFKSFDITATSPNPVDICTGGNTTLSIFDLGALYAWTGLGLDLNFGAIVNATPPAVGASFYLVTAVGENQCVASYTFTVNGLALPTTQLIAVNQTICGAAIDLGVINSGATSLTYFDGIANNTVAFAGNSFNVPLLVGSNDISLISVSGATCANTTASGTVNILRRSDTDPICTCSGKGILLNVVGNNKCEGNSSNFGLLVSVTGVSPLSIEVLQNGDMTSILTFSGLNQGFNSLQVSPDVSTDYTIYAVTAGSCQGSGSGSSRIDVIPLPVLSVTSPVIVNCTTTAVDLSNYFVDTNTTFPGLVTYWTGNNYTIPSSNFVTASGIYLIRKIASGLSTCTGEAAISVVFQSRPTALVFGGGSVCSGQSTNVSASFSGGSAPYSFLFGNATTTSSIQSSSGLFSTQVGASNDLYTIAGISDANGCIISVSGAAVVAISPTSLCGGNVVCTTAPSAPILAQQAAQCGEIKTNWTPQLVDYYSFTLQSMSGNVLSTGTTAGFNTSFSGLSAGNYNVIVRASNACGTSPESTLAGINTTAALTAVISGGGQVCANQKAILDFALTGVAPFSMTLTNGTSYLLKPGNFTITVGGLTENYTVATLTDATGCTNLTTSTGTDINGIFPQNASILIASKFTSSCQSGKFIFTSTGVNGGSAPSFNWFVNNKLISLTGVNYSVAGIEAIGNNGFLTISGLGNNDTISAQLVPDPLAASCVLNANTVFSLPIFVNIESIDLTAAISYVPTQCLNSSDGILYVNLPAKYAGRSFNYNVNTIAGVAYNPLITVGGLLANKLKISITDIDNPQCTLDTITNGTGTVNATIVPTVKDSDCNSNNGSISIYFKSDFLSYNATISGVNTVTGLNSVISVVSNIVSDSASSYKYKFGQLAVGLYQINLEYNNCFASLEPIEIGGGSTPVVDLGADLKICRGDSVILTTSGVAGGLYSWFKNDSLVSAGPFNYLPIRPTQNAIYSVSVPGSNGCFATDFVLVNVADIALKLATTALPSDTMVNLVWTYLNKISLSDTSFQIQSRSGAGNIFSPWTVAGFATLRDTLFSHRNSATKASVQAYRIVGVNIAACASAPHDLVFLKGTSVPEENKVELNWTRYKGWTKGVDHYEVWRKVDDEAGFSFVQTAGVDSTIELLSVTEGFRHQYRILAVSKEPVQDSIKSWSNSVMLEFNRQIAPYNAFSPNGDGKNDAYEVKNILSWADNEIFIFNRWGGKVFYAKPYRNDWTGDGMPDGTYFYIINLNDKNNTPAFKGSILLQR